MRTCTVALIRLLGSISTPLRQIPQDAETIVEVMLKTMRDHWPEGMTSEEAQEALSGDPSFECQAADIPSEYLERYQEATAKRVKLRREEDFPPRIEQPEPGDFNREMSQPATLFMSNVWRSITDNFQTSESSVLRRFGGPSRAGPRLIRPLLY